jgi:hypothetical protein
VETLSEVIKLIEREQIREERKHYFERLTKHLLTAFPWIEIPSIVCKMQSNEWIQAEHQLKVPQYNSRENLLKISCLPLRNEKRNFLNAGINADCSREIFNCELLTGYPIRVCMRAPDGKCNDQVAELSGRAKSTITSFDEHQIL